ncbi:MAG: hypothetical protein GYA23_03380 [Methanomicrobiales archaeon]|nr:hypothetical protein [Methanomicrobiales archaeon]
MNARAGFVWATRQHFCRFIEDSGIGCELITPHMLAAPFFRPTLSCLIIPTGFGNPAYSNLLPALRASSERINRFVEKGGNLLVFGAAVDNPEAYDWLPFPLRYCHDHHPRTIRFSPESETRTIIADYDASCVECDGTFSVFEADCPGRCGDSAVLVQKTLGNGTVIVTTIHEYPSRTFLQDFCRRGPPVVF